MTTPKRSTGFVAFAFFLILIGTGWLLMVQGVFGEVNWLWQGCLAACAVLPVLLWGLDRVTFAFFVLFAGASVMSIMRQMGRLSVDVEVPALVIATGVVMLLARWMPLRNPGWIEEMKHSG